jgi:hypothetical protein
MLTSPAVAEAATAIGAGKPAAPADWRMAKGDPVTTFPIEEWLAAAMLLATMPALLNPALASANCTTNGAATMQPPTTRSWFILTPFTKSIRVAPVKHPNNVNGHTRKRKGLYSCTGTDAGINLINPSRVTVDVAYMFGARSYILKCAWLHRRNTPKSLKPRQQKMYYNVLAAASIPIR